MPKGNPPLWQASAAFRNASSVQLSAFGGPPAGYMSCRSMLAYFFIRSMREQGAWIWLPTVAGTAIHLPFTWPRYFTTLFTSPFCLRIGSIMSLTGSSSSAWV